MANWRWAIMSDQEIKDMAIDCGALVKKHPKDAETTLIIFTLGELKEFIGQFILKDIR